MGHPTFISIKSASIVLFSSSAQRVILSGKDPAICKKLKTNYHYVISAHCMTAQYLRKCLYTY